jgi:hypothetical protein
MTDNYEPLMTHWLLDIENSLALISGKLAATLIEGEPLSDRERRCGPWLEAALMNGGLMSEEEISKEHTQFLMDFVNKQNEAAIFVTWMEKHVGRRVLSSLAKKALETSEKYVIVAMLKHLCLVDDAIQFIQTLKTGDVSADPNASKFISVAQEAGKITTMLQQKGQAEREWRIAMEDRPTADAFNTTWRDEKKEKLMEMCELKEVLFNPQDEKETINALYEKLQADIQATSATGPLTDPYESVSVLVVERAKLLLRMRPARITVEHPTAETPNPFAVHRDKPLTSSVPDNGTEENPRTLRASSYLPKTDAVISKEAKQARAEQKNKAFNRRLRELRKWLQAYRSW